MKEFCYFLGVDQTGATLGKDQAKPLKVCLAKKTGSHWSVFTETPKQKPLTIKALNESNLVSLLEPFEIAWPAPQLAIHIDCVFGLPKKTWPMDINDSTAQGIWNLFQRVKKHEYHGKRYGRFASQDFFEQILKASQQNEPPKRECETISGSNSIFTTTPFQKNIQTGSYRIWRDLVSESETPWLNLWPFEHPKKETPKRSWIFEGYPSLIWKKYLGIRSRNLKAFTDWLRQPLNKTTFRFDSFKRLSVDSDLADSVVLALGGVLLQNQKKLFTPFPLFETLDCLSREGWIAGVEK